jgi:DNA-binding NarL/FixJ family response regulator
VPTRVLIVDDHASFRGLARRVLAAFGFAVVGEACDARSALLAAAALEPDVVLLDVVLPDRSGLHVAAELARTPHPPRVILTSSRGRSDFGPGFEWPPGCEFVPKHQVSGPLLTALLASA